MLINYITELIGEVPQSLSVVVYLVLFILVLFGLAIILKIISVFFSKFI